MTAPSPSRRVAFAAEVEIRRATPSGLALREEPCAPVALTDAHARREKQIPRVGTTDDVVEPEASPAPAAEADEPPPRPPAAEPTPQRVLFTSRFPGVSRSWGKQLVALAATTLLGFTADSPTAPVWLVTENDSRDLVRRVSTARVLA